MNPQIVGGYLFQSPQLILESHHLCFPTWLPSGMKHSLPVGQRALPWAALLEHPSFLPRLSVQAANSR